MKTRRAVNRIGVEPFDVGYGARFQAGGDLHQAIECRLVEDDGVFLRSSSGVGHPPAPACVR